MIGIAYLYSMFVSPFTNNQCQTMSCRWANLLDTWKIWQSLNASVIAFVSGLLVIYSTTLSEQTKMLQKRKVARAFLPKALAEISNYLKEMASELRKPDLPQSALKRIESFLEFTQPEDSLLSEHLVIVINTLQVYDSRLDGYYDRRRVRQDLQAFNQINLCTKLSALISGMYSYARNQEEIYENKTLDCNMFGTNDINLYMTKEELDECSKKPITLELFCS
ncbi:hypothetical protein [Vibrio nomapromontoriensis]|uniref:hypothetical protein n=1 Tax=Vibrio nomapromontoriensis TaxID=2910246 RepID=UPI003D0F94F3